MWVKSSSDYAAVRTWLGEALLAAANHRPPRLAPDALAWVAYLFWLNSCLSAGVLVPADLTRDEMEGLRLMDEAAQELKGKLHRCPRCGALTESLLTCPRCGQRLAPEAPVGHA